MLSYRPVFICKFCLVVAYIKSQTFCNLTMQSRSCFFIQLMAASLKITSPSKQSSTAGDQSSHRFLLLGHTEIAVIVNMKCKYHLQVMFLFLKQYALSIQLLTIPLQFSFWDINSDWLMSRSSCKLIVNKNHCMRSRYKHDYIHYQCIATYEVT